MDVTVVLCTLDRAARLRSALDDLRRQEMPPHVAWEVLVVDNGSTDRTREVVEAFIRAEPERFRYVSEPRRGKSQALNTGIEHAPSAILAFTDDDVEIDRRWLPELVRMFDETACVGVGGRIVPSFPVPPPDWLARSTNDRYLRLAMAEFDLGDEPHRLTRPPFGGNVAYRREVFQQHGAYRVDLGPTDGTPMGRGEDVEMADRLLRAGGLIMYAPEAIIRNIIPPERMNKKYFATWWYHQGRASVMTESYGPEVRTWFGVPRYLYRCALEAALGCATGRDERTRFLKRLALMESLGKAAQAASMRRQGVKWGGCAHGASIAKGKADPVARPSRP